MYHGINRSVAAEPIDRSARSIAMRSRRSARAEEARYHAAQAEIDGQAGHRRPARPAPALPGLALLRRS